MKKIFWFLLISGLLLFQAKPYLRTGFPYTHDGENHLARFANYKIALKEGQIPPRFAPNLLNHYGYPVFNYNYPLANMASLPLSAAKLNYELTFKLIAGTFLLIGIIGAKRWSAELTEIESDQAIAVTMYGLSPYLITTILYRGNIGELTAWALLPWLMVMVEKFRSSNLPDWRLSPYILVLTSFFLSHNIFALFGTALVLAYALIRFGMRLESWKQLGLVLIMSILASLWFWLPALAEKQLIVLDEANLSQDFVGHFPTVGQLLTSPVSFGFSKIGSVDSLSSYTGLVSILAVALAWLMIVKSWFAERRWLGNLTGVTALATLALIFQLRLTQVVWESVPLAHFIQFPWRLGLLFNLIVVGVTALLLNYSTKTVRLVFTILLVLQLLAFNRLKPVDYFHKLNRDYDAFSQTTSTANENMPISFGYQDFADWQPTAEVIAGTGEITVEYWKGSDRQYSVRVDELSAIVEPTAWFAGWQTQAINQDTGQTHLVTYIDNPIINGRIAYELEPGSYTIRSRFTQWTWPRLVGNTVSVITIVVLFGNYALGAWQGSRNDT